jgi:hypothetical protein
LTQKLFEVARIGWMLAERLTATHMEGGSIETEITAEAAIP